MLYFLTAFPIFLLLVLMLIFKWSSPRAGFAAWCSALLVAVVWFGMTPETFWVSQAKGLLLSINVLAILWPALFLYNLVQRAGGIQALVNGLGIGLDDKNLLALILAWAFSGFLEGLAGFGIPIAVVAPILFELGIEPVTAVAAVAVGHAWAVTFGDMGVIIQTLSGVVQIDISQLVPTASLLLGMACILCGLGAAWLLGQIRKWPLIIIIGFVMACVQFLVANLGLPQLAGFIAGLSGVGAGWAYGVVRKKKRESELNNVLHKTVEVEATTSGVNIKRMAAKKAIFLIPSYGALIVLMLLVSLPGPIRSSLYSIAWLPTFPQVATTQGFVTPAAAGQVFRFFIHPGIIILLTGVLCTVIFSMPYFGQEKVWKSAAASTWSAALAPTFGIIATVGLSTMLEHAGVTFLLATGLSQLVGQAFPIISPWIGILGAFASGSNNNSNILFGMLQKNMGTLLGISPVLLVAAQTTGGALGSMIAPAKIVVGCSTVGIRGRDGEVLKKTLLFGIGIGLLIGIIVFVFKV